MPIELLGRRALADRCAVQSDHLAVGFGTGRSAWVASDDRRQGCIAAQHPGNKIYVSIDEAGRIWSITIDNLSTGESFSTTTPYSS
jgi:hypothetical protein